MKIGVVGCAGRMGQMVVRQVLATPGICLVGAVAEPGAAAVGRDAGLVVGAEPAGVTIGDDPLPVFAAADAVIDFTAPAASVEFARLAAQGRTAHIIGTTGLDAAQEQALAEVARHTPIVYAANMSLGVNLLVALVEQVARRLDPVWDIEIVEMHHRHKVDAPSGTAIALGRAAAAGRQVALDTVAVRGRDGVTGARAAGAIGFAALRGGDVVGDHTVIFAGPAERLELSHRAASREIFARGAITAALWAHRQPPGLYGMKDVLGL